MKRVCFRIGIILFLVFGIYFETLPSAGAEGEDSPAVSGGVNVEVEVMPSLAMRIHSNADIDAESFNDAYGFIGYEPASAKQSSDPEAIDGPSAATGLQLSANQIDTATLYSKIEIRSNTGRFKLEVQDVDNDTALRDSNNSTTVNEYIPAGVSFNQDGSINPLVAGWALKGGEISNWTAITSSLAEPLIIRSAASNNTDPLNYSQEITVNYAIASGISKHDTYRDTIMYTATVLDQDASAVEIAEPGQTASSTATPGETKTISGTGFTALDDGKFWINTPLGNQTWTEAKTACPAGSHLSTKDEIGNLITLYGGSSSGLYDATGWSGQYWTSTAHEGSNAWAALINNIQAFVYSDYAGDEYAEGNLFGALCVGD